MFSQSGSHINKESHGTAVCYQKKAWMDEKLMLRWISDICIKHTKNKPSLLFSLTVVVLT